MKKILIFSPHFLPHLGGVEQYAFSLAKDLTKKGHIVKVVTSQLGDQPIEDIMDGIGVHRVPSFPLLDGRFPVTKPFGVWKKIKSALHKWKPDFILVNTRFYPLSYFAVHFAKSINIPSAVVEHGTAHFTVNNALFDKLGHLYEHVVTHLVKCNCQNFYGVSKACNQWVEHFGIKSTGVIYNSIDPERIEMLSCPPIKDFRKTYGLLRDAFVVTYTGRLVKEKGILKLIEAIQRLKKTYPNIYLFIAGDGDLLASVKNLDETNIIALGKIDFPHIIALLKQTNVFCLPTDYPEGLPTSVLEAAACRCFIITTASGGSKELISSEDYGVILSENTAESIGFNIEKSMCDDTYRNNAVDLTYQALMKNFTWNKTGDAVLNIIEGDKHDEQN